MKKAKQAINIDEMLSKENIIDTEITDVLYDSTLNYALSVITDRALPDIKDGLKPVQRRILWAAYNKKIMPNSNFVKCAQVSGEVMGKYHPHGCLWGATEIYLTDGRKATIEKLYHETQKNPNRRYRVLCLDKNNKPAIGFMYNVRIGQMTKEVYLINLSNGGSLRLTGNHPVLVMRDVPTYIEVKDLKVNDVLISGDIVLMPDMTIASVNNGEIKTMALIKDYDVRIEYEHNLPPMKVEKRMFNKKTRRTTIKRKTIPHPPVFKIKHVSAIDTTQDMPLATMCHITTIEKLTFKKEIPTYDFSVEDYENAFFIVKTSGTPKTHSIVNLHNSSYNTMANMSQPWTFRYPLMDFHGNNGDMDGYPPSAERYCVTGDSLVNTDKGLIKIQDIVSNDLNSDNDIDITVKSFNMNNKASKLFNSGKHKVYNITFKNNQSIKATSNHPLLVLNNSLDLQWKTVEELKIGDRCAIDINTFNTLYGQYENIEESKMLAAVTITKYTHLKNKVRISSKDNDLLNIISNYYKTDIDNNKLYISTFDYDISNIPNQILQGTKNNQIAYLRLLFEYNAKVKDNVIYISDNEAFIKTLQILLASNFGILSEIKQNRNKFSLVLNNYHIDRFKEIGFVSEEKNKLLNDIDTTIKNDNILYISQVKDFIIKHTNKLNNINSIQDLINSDILDEEMYNYLYSLLQYAYIPITNIEEQEEQIVYSIRVDSECHSFTANAIVNHNTETRLHKNALALLDGVDEQAVDFRPNYSETCEEPCYLPGLLPNLLVNGAYGIAVGYTTKFPSHNLSEVIDGIIAYIKDNNITLKELMKCIKAPDFPLGGLLIKNNNIQQLYETGTAKLTFKAKYVMEENKETHNQQIVFTELPPDCNKPKLMQTLYKLCIEEKEIPRIVDIRDETSGTSNVRVVIELHKTAVLNIVLDNLYKKTNLQQDISYIMRCIDDNQPKLLPLVDLIKNYIDFHTNCYVNRFNYLINKYNKKLHTQEGYQKILTNLNKAITIIQKSTDINELKQTLIDTFKLSEEQVNIVLEMKLRNLTKLSKDEVNNTINELNTNITHYQNLLNNKDLFNQNFINDLEELKKTLGDKRRTELVTESKVEIQETNEDYILCLTNRSNIKHYNEEDFKSLTKYKEKQDMIIKAIKYNTKNNLMLILQDGNYICVPFDFILGDLSKYTNKTKIIDIIELETNIDKKLFLMTNKGTISKINLDKIKLKKIYPLIAIQDEQIIKTALINDIDDEIFTVITKDGQIARHFIKSFSSLNPNNKGLKLNYDNVQDFSCDDKKYIICVTEDNKISKFNITDFMPKSRISKPVNACKCDNIKGLYIVDDITYITSKGEIKTFDINKIKTNNKNTKPIDYKLDIAYIK